MPEAKDQINVKGIDPELLKRAKIMAIEKDKSLSEILRDNLEELVADYEKEKKLKAK